MKQNSVCGIIVTYNIGNDFYKCFNSVRDQVEKVIIVDNGSDEDTTSVLKNIKKNNNHVEVIYNKENLGIGHALNQGVELALENNFEWILTMDNDSEATNSMVDIMINTYNKAISEFKTNVVSIFPRYIEKGFYDSNLNEKSESRLNEYEGVECEITSGNLLKADIFKKIGGFRDDYFIDYVDHEYCLRMIKNGYSSIRAKDAILLHSLGNSKKKIVAGKTLTYTNHSASRRYYITRNRFDVWNKYKDIPNDFIKHDKSAYKKEIIKIIAFEDDKINKISSIFKGIRDFKKNKFGKK